MFGRWTFDVTGIASPGGENILAVKVFPLDFPGLPGEPQLKAFGPFGLNGGPTGDIGKNVTMHCSVGWDWMPEIHDRNMGIWQDVEVSATGPVDIRDPQIVTDLPLPDVSTADIVVKADVCNVSDAPQEGTLTLRVFPPARRQGDRRHHAKSLPRRARDVEHPIRSPNRAGTEDQEPRPLVAQRPWPAGALSAGARFRDRRARLRVGADPLRHPRVLEPGGDRRRLGPTRVLRQRRPHPGPRRRLGAGHDAQPLPGAPARASFPSGRKPISTSSASGAEGRRRAGSSSTSATSSGSSSGTTSGSRAIAREPGTREVRITPTTPARSSPTPPPR